MGIKVNDQVEVIQPTVSGVVVDVQWDKDIGEPRALVQVAENQQRWFLASELQIVGGEG